MHFRATLLLPLAAVAMAACSDGTPLAPAVQPDASTTRILDCVADVRAGTVACSEPTPAGSASRLLIGGQGTYVQLTSSNVAFTETGAAGSGTGTFAFDVTIRNLLGVTSGTTRQGMATVNGEVADSGGVKVLFNSLTVTAAVDNGQPATAEVANETGSRSFAGSEAKPFFKYAGAELAADRFPGILASGETSSAKNWQLALVNVNTFAFRLYVSTELEHRLVINEVLANAETACEVNGEYFELYNAGNFPIDLGGFMLADSAPVGRGRYFPINRSLVIAPGRHLVLGAGSTENCGAPINYSYDRVLDLSNGSAQTGDAIKLARVMSPGDTVTIDRVEYNTFQVNGVARELKNPDLSNFNVSGGEWDDAAVNATFGNPAQRGTPGARNSVYRDLF